MADLEKRTLGRTGLPVTVLGYGAMELRGPAHWRKRDIPESQAGTVLNGVLDAGINFVDTSIDYGTSEELIGKYISGRRSEYFLASKCGCIVDAPQAQTRDQRPSHDFTRENIRRGVENSLRRLKTDYLDLVQFHATPSKQTLEDNESLQEVLDLKQEGKLRFIGMSGTLPNLRDHIAMGVFDSFQIPYSALERDHEDLITQAEEAGAGIVVRGGVAKGDPDAGGHGGQPWDLWQKADLDDLLDGMTPTQFLLRFTISHPHMHTTIVGTANPDHLADNVKVAAMGPLPTDVYEEAKRRLANAGVVPA
jgi:aryl-alcohol dehydrogenase-like predicted oxidoreductase